MQEYKKLVIYYFSGTGNSENVALWLSKIALEKGIETKLINIAKIDRLNIGKPEKGALVIFISPIHGFNYPPVMFHFIGRFPKGNNNVVLMNTRAGMLIGKFITPGLTGIAFYLAMILLKIKGYSIKGMFPVDLPSNWISIHPGLNERTVKFLHKKNKERISLFAEKIFSGRSVFKALREIIQDLLVSPIAFLYYFIGRFALAKSYYASKDCNNCDLCINNCPVKAIIRVNNRPFWTFNCESCMRCMSFCNKKAIETAHGFFIGIMILNSSVILLLFYKYFNIYFFEIKNEVLKFIIEPIIMLSALAVTYRITHYLMRFRFFERMMVFTSLTKLKFWGRRYRAIKNL